MVIIPYHIIPYIYKYIYIYRAIFLFGVQRREAWNHCPSRQEVIEAAKEEQTKNRKAQCEKWEMEIDGPVKISPSIHWVMACNIGDFFSL